MTKFKLRNEWKFISSEINSFNDKNIPYLKREVLFMVQLILLRYCSLQSRFNKIFLKEVYQKTKMQYLKTS